MSNQPSTGNYDPVYQLETSDPVQGGLGGLSNRPLAALTSRTDYLNNLLATLAANLANYAQLNSPAFTGSPTVPDPPVGDKSSRISNTEWVQKLVEGANTIAVTGGNKALIATDIGYAALIFTGALASAETIQFPAGTTGIWVISNQTSGAFPLTVDLVGDSSPLAVAQGDTLMVWLDGTAPHRATNDFTSVFLGGVPTAPNPPLNTATQQLATTAFVTAQIAAGFSGAAGPPGWVQLPNGLIIQWGGVSITAIPGSNYSQSYTLPHSFNTAQVPFCCFFGPSPPTTQELGIQADPTYPLAKIQLTVSSNAGAGGTLGVNYFAIGY